MVGSNTPLAPIEESPPLIENNPLGNKQTLARFPNLSPPSSYAERLGEKQRRNRGRQISKQAGNLGRGRLDSMEGSRIGGIRIPRLEGGVRGEVEGGVLVGEPSNEHGPI